MDFSIEFYETASGGSPVADFLRDLKRTDPKDFASVLAVLDRMRNRLNHRPPLSKPISEGLFEMRHVGKLNTRVFFFFAPGRRIIAVHGMRNKGWTLPARDLRTAKERMRDWKARQAA